MGELVITKEIWKDISGFEGIYQVSNLGQVKSLKRLSRQKHLIPERVLKQRLAVNNNRKTEYAYLEVELYKDGVKHHKKVHRLVAETFINNPNGYNEVDHIDGNKLNNNCDNLRWVTHQQNQSNPLLVKKLRDCNIGKVQPKEAIKKLSKKIVVIKDGVIVHVFSSYKDMDMNSKEIIGTQLWNVYARDCVKGKRESYKGFKFSVVKE